MFRNARCLCCLVLGALLVNAACSAQSGSSLTPASITIGQRAEAAVAARPGVTTVAYDPNHAAPELPPLAPGEARLYATQIALPTYPIEAYQQAAFDPTYRWPYLRFDREHFQADAPPAETRFFELLVLENEYLVVSILPELGGRIWQIVHKPTGDTMFYQNHVIKPSPWGPASQLGWLAVGGLEWALPVNEHGYDWGTPWHVTTFQKGTMHAHLGRPRANEGSVGVRISTPEDGRLLAAEIEVSLQPGQAFVTISPTIRNLAAHTLDFHFWQTAMLAPGPGNAVTADLRFVTPSKIMSTHSTGDTMLPGPGLRFTWPRYFGRDLSRLGNWDRYVGFFEYPRAHGPFVGVYDPTLDVGAVRVFPAEIVQGSKVFGLGWRNRIGSEDFTDDGSSYVELHGGLSPTFDEPYSLAAHASVQWEERWYPVAGLGNLTYATDRVALNLERTTLGLHVALYPSASLRGTLAVLDAVGEATLAEFPLDLMPGQVFARDLDTITPARGAIVRVLDEDGATLLDYTAGATHASRLR